MKRYPSALVALLLSGCAIGGTPAANLLPAEQTAQSESGVTGIGRGIPVADHHQHLFSPALADIVNGDAPKPRIALPKDLAQLLQARADRWNDKAALAELYVPDSLVLGRSRGGWVRGSAEGAAALSAFARPYYLTPVELRLADSHAQVGGYYSRGDQTAPQHIGFFQMSLEKGGDGTWRITQETPVFPFPTVQDPITAREVVAMLDEAKIGRAVLLSEAFWLDSPLIPLEDAYAKVRAENDWTLNQASQFPDRLVPFCSFNPVADHALQELERCSALPGFRGLKFSFAMSRVDLLDAGHVARLKAVFAEANRKRLPLVIHLTGGAGHGAEHVRVFVGEVLPLAPDVPVQVAHLWGGEGFSEPALAALTTAVEQKHPAAGNLYFDLAEVWTAGPDHSDTIAAHVRRIGLDRILYGSDAALNGRLPPREAWKTLQTYLPLTDAEFRQIAANKAPYLQ